MAELPARRFLEVLNDDVLLRICRFLPAGPLLGIGSACCELQQRTQDCLELWKALCEFLLGRTTLLLHESCWGDGDGASRDASFYRRLFRAAWKCEEFCYDSQLRGALLRSMQQGHATEAQEVSKLQNELLCMSGHTAEAIGPLIVQIGGMKNEMGLEEVINVTIVNLLTRQIVKPTLSPDSITPQQRMRHATCVVAAKHLPPSAFSEAILVLGGHDGNVMSHSAGIPRAAVHTLLFLQVTRPDGSEIRWHAKPAFGMAPEYLYNHACASFAGGRQVCVFGGDIPRSDPEFVRIIERDTASFVYVLNVPSGHWSVVSTSGPGPAWRSFHAAAAHTSLLDGRDYFVTFGGTAEHCEPFSGGSLADMRGYELAAWATSWFCTKSSFEIWHSPLGPAPADSWRTWQYRC